MCDKAFETCPFIFHSISDWFKTQKNVWQRFFQIFFYAKILSSFKTQEMCDKAVDNFLPTLKFVPYWFVSNEIIKKVYSALFTDNDNSFLMKILGMSHFQ